MAESGRGLPLLSGPPPPNDLTHAEIACRKCNKEFNLIFTRSRKCSHCGYSYCYSCSDYQALVPRPGSQAGYDTQHVCAFCIEFLTITAAGKGYLKSQPLSKLKKYVNAYNIKINGAVEKDDLIDAIIGARGPNGCLPPENERFYVKYSVPNPPAGTRRRGIFSRSGQSAPPPPPPPIPTRPTTTFARPDLAPDDPPPPPQQQYPPPPGPPPNSSYNRPAYPPPPQPQYQAPPHPPPHQHQPPYNAPQQQGGYHPPPPNASTYPGYYPQYNRYNPHYHAPSPNPPPPPMPPQASRPQGNPYSHPRSQNIPAHHQPTPPPRPRTTPAAPTAPAPSPPTPPPTLDALLTMSNESISALGIGVLKSILFTNHVNSGMILEKSDLVKKVMSLVEDEKRERERARLTEEAERLEREERERERREEREREERERERESTAREREPVTLEVDDDAIIRDHEAVEEVSPHATDSEPRSEPPVPNNGTKPLPPPPPALPSKAQAMASHLERTGLCVICQDEDANIAIIDCGHMAMCRACSELIMSSTRECPLCRTRIVTEQRLLRIFKT